MCLGVNIGETKYYRDSIRKDLQELVSLCVTWSLWLTLGQQMHADRLFKVSTMVSAVCWRHYSDLNEYDHNTDPGWIKPLRRFKKTLLFLKKGGVSDANYISKTLI